MADMQEFTRRVFAKLTGNQARTLNRVLHDTRRYSRCWSEYTGALQRDDVGAAVAAVVLETERQRELDAQAALIRAQFEAEKAKRTPSLPKILTLARAYQRLTGVYLTLPKVQDHTVDDREYKPRRGPTHIIPPEAA